LRRNRWSGSTHFVDEKKTHVESELAAAEADYRAARVAGTIALAIGLALATAANFVG
jgi:hypothetical protein